jgi:hypothetical protein
VCRPAFDHQGRLDHDSYTYEVASFVPVGLFTDHALAEARAQLAEQELRRSMSPFTIAHHLSLVTSLDDRNLRKRLRALGIPDTENCPERNGLKGTELEDWWDRIADGLSDAQRDAVWELFDRLKVFEVRPIEVDM